MPVVGDFNGDGIDELGVYRDGTWYIDTNGNCMIDDDDQVFQLGAPGDMPVVGDWDGDGTADPGVYREGARRPARQASKQSGFVGQAIACQNRSSAPVRQMLDLPAKSPKST